MVIITKGMAKEKKGCMQILSSLAFLYSADDD